MLQIQVIRIGVQGPAGPQGPQGAPGANGNDANVNAANVAAAIATMNADQVTALLVKLGFTTYANLATANANLNIGDVFRDSSDSKFKTATE